jgi:hypothetical protein
MSIPTEDVLVVIDWRNCKIPSLKGHFGPSWLKNNNTTREIKIMIFEALNCVRISGVGSSPTL